MYIFDLNNTTFLLKRCIVFQKMPLLFEKIKNRQVFLLSPNRSINNNSFNTSNVAMFL